MMSSCPNPQFWRNKRVLLTGHTGFKGAWLSAWLLRMGAQVTGISLPAATQPNLYGLLDIKRDLQSHLIDIRDAAATAGLIRDAAPDIVLHLAAQPLVRASYHDPLGTFSTNVQGTANVLDALRTLSTPRVVVAVTTDKVYRNLEQQKPFQESDRLGGHDPYSASKAASELVIDCYRQAFLQERGVALASARAGNVIGGGDWAEDRLIPDAVGAWSRQQTLEIRRPDAVRPWQHVLEPLAAYLRLAERLWVDPALAGAYNFGPLPHESASVRDVITMAQSFYGSGTISWGVADAGPHEAGFLTLDVNKARQMLGIHPRWDIETSIEMTMRWYRSQLAGASAYALCLADIATFEQQPAVELACQ